MRVAATFLLSTSLASEALAVPRFWSGSGFGVSNKHVTSSSSSSSSSPSSNQPQLGNGYIDLGHHVESSPSPPSSAPSTAPLAASDGVAHSSGGKSYMVLFKNGHTSSGAPGSVNALATDTDTESNEVDVDDVLLSMGLTPDHDDVKTTYRNKGFRGFTAALQSHCLDLLKNDSNIAVVEEVQTVSIQAANVRSGTTWGLERISQAAPVSGDPNSLSFNYNYDDSSLGAGVDIYVVDTGVTDGHVVFNGRATSGFSYDNDPTDGEGHGTHVAATAGGATFGVASGANIIGIKVLDASGQGSSDDTVRGIEYVTQQHNARKSDPNFKGSVLSMSWGVQGNSQIINAAIQNAIDSGVHAVVAAGNNAGDACTYSPSSLGGANGPAISVGSIGPGNAISSFSDTGSCTDVYAPGEEVISAWNTGPNVINVLDGTSMATPHVTGVVAYTLAQRPDLALDPAGMKAVVVGQALQGQVTGLAQNGDQMLLLNNGVSSTAAPAKKHRSAKRGGEGFVIRKSASGLAGLAARAASWLDRRQTFWLAENAGGLYY